MDGLTLPLLLMPIAIGVALFGWERSRQALPLPPQPEGNWLFGNALDIAKAPAFWLKLAEYTDQYGPFISIRLLTRRTFVVSDPQLISELFEKRAANYSDRNVTEILKLIGWETDVVAMQYGPTHKRYRTMMNRALNNRKALGYIPLQQHEVQRFMRRLLDNPEQFMDHVRLLAASLAIRISYGYKVKSYDDEFVQTAEKSTQGFANGALPWGWAVNLFPFLRYLPDWLPIAPFQRRVIELRKALHDHREKPFAFVEGQMTSGIAENSFVSRLLQPEDGSVVDAQIKVDIKRIAATIYAGGSDTTVAVVHSFFLAMTLYPEAQVRAYEEIAKYCQDRDPRTMLLPADRPNLPYTNALVRELLRWHPVIPVVLHRSSDQDDNNVAYQGKIYSIPARSDILANVWATMHDPKVYPDPERFVPERYLVSDPPPGPENFAFGFGRRICPGMHVAQQSAWITISNLLLNFAIVKSKDEDGKEITPQERYTTDIISHPLPFVCSITPREGCRELLQDITD